MPKSTNKLAEKFIAKSKVLESTRQKIEKIFLNGGLSVSDAEQVYVGLFLDIFTEFEAIIEDLFIGLLTGKLYIKASKNPRKLKIVPVSSTLEVLLNGKPYVDWLPYDNTKKRADRFFTEGRPFTKLNDVQVKSLGDYQDIRNALAHKSASSRKKFAKLIANLTLLPKERTPIGYLMSKPQGPGTETQYQIAVNELSVMVKALCS